MQGLAQQEVTINVRADTKFLPVATGFVEKAAAAFGIDQGSVLALTLAIEEIFAYLCHVAAPGQEVQLRCLGGGYYAQAEFVFQARDFNMKAFNLTTSLSFEDEAAFEETGLLIASRMVDRFKFEESEGRLRLSLIKEKAYPAASHMSVPEATPLDRYEIREPDPEELKIFVHMMMDGYDPQFMPSSFRFPGKMVDMVQSGDYKAALAMDSRGRVGGGIVWRRESSKMVECYGPYLFCQPPESHMSRGLLDFCLGAIVRSEALGLINRYPTPELPLEYFEPLGALRFRRSDGSSADLRAYYRHLEEDLGSAVWAHPSLEEFLTREYRRLVFARDIRRVKDEGETASPFAVLSAEFDRPQERVTLRPVWWGGDSQAVVALYVAVLRKEQIPCITFEMDLGKPWHCRFAPAVLNSDFEPRFVLPYGGRGDLVVFEHKVD